MAGSFELKQEALLVVKFLYIALLAVFVCDLYLIFSGNDSARLFTKTLLVPLLMLILYFSGKTKGMPFEKLFFGGLLFSFFGDFFLLFNWGFLPGLGSFLIAHVLYIFCFRSLAKVKVPVIFAVAILLYLVGLLVFLLPHISDMKIPVVAYGITISTMLYFSLKTGNKFLIFGALFFVASDSILAYNLFINSSLSLNLSVMCIYIFAQYLLVRGIIEEQKTQLIQ